MRQCLPHGCNGDGDDGGDGISVARAVLWRWRRGDGGGDCGGKGGSRWMRQEGGRGEDSGAVWGRKSRFHSVCVVRRGAVSFGLMYVLPYLESVRNTPFFR